MTGPSGVDFDDPDYGFKEEDKPAQKVGHLPRMSTLCVANGRGRNKMKLYSKT